MPNLSKSKILAYRQCPKRLWLEIHKPELRDDSASQQVFAIGNLVGEIARIVYDHQGTGTVIQVGELGHAAALAKSATLLAEGTGPVFEAGLTAAGALAYADVMLPDRSNGTLRWKMIEVKASTHVKDYHHDDIAVQAYIAAHSGTPLSSVSLANINNSFVYQGDGNYHGLFREIDFTEQTNHRFDEVREWILGAQSVAALTEEPIIETGPQCNKPFDCAFLHYCHEKKVKHEYPLSSLPRLPHKKRTQLNEEGIHDLRHVPDHYLSGIQSRVKKHTAEGTIYFDAAGAAADLAPYGLPAYFLDFEAIQFAVPIWKETSPYQAYPFQFSLHVMNESGDLQHHEFLDLSGDDPRQFFARSLIECCGTHGPIFAYNASYEAGVMHKLAKRFPEYAPSLQAIIKRLVDLLPIAQNRYYHPSQHGSWSLKSVLPALCPDLSYNDLENVKNGNDAGNAYLEAIAAHTTPERKAELQTQLHEYCKLDTMALVRIWQKFRGV